MNLILNYRFCFTSSRNSLLKIFSFNFHRVSAVFPPVQDASNSESEKSASHSHVLMLENGIIFNQYNGLFTLLPLGLRSVEKLSKLIDTKMKNAGCQKINLPLLTSASLWKKSGRLANCGVEVMRLIDRNQQELILSPTHEESVTYLMSGIKNLSTSHLPIKLYQITPKFRDEMRLKHGLLRGREFLMKDLYTFDKDITKAQETFELICGVYEEIFSTLKIPAIKVEASVGAIGGVSSKEFHIPSKIGEDELLVCDNCSFAINNEVDSEISSCPSCKNCKLRSINGIEIGHAFLLGNKYSSPLSALYRNEKGKPNILEMGCYGIGVTRLLAAGIEALSKDKRIVWPSNLSPFKVCIIPPKKGSKEYVSSHWCYHLEAIINQIPGFEEEVIVDDRIKLSIGQRCNWARQFGFPIVIVIGKSSLSSVPHFELINTEANLKLQLTQCSIIKYLKDNTY